MALELLTLLIFTATQHDTPSQSIVSDEGCSVITIISHKLAVLLHVLKLRLT